MRILISLIPLLALLLSACSGADHTALLNADAIMEEHPDSALSILSAIDRDKLNDRDLPYYALLMTQAQVKNDIPIDSDTLISIAYRKYADDLSGDKGIRASYYMGDFAIYRTKSGEALKYYLSTYANAKSLHNHLWTARSAERIADMFYKAYNFSEAARYCRESAEAYGLADRQSLKIWAEARLHHINQLITKPNWNPTAQHNFTDSILRKRYNKASIDSILTFSNGISSDIAYWKMCNIDFMYDMLEGILPDKANLDGAVFYSHILRLENKIKESDSVLEDARRYASSNEDRLEILYSQYLNAKKAIPASRIETLADSIIIYQEMAVNSMMTETLNGIVNDFYIEQSIRNEKKTRIILWASLIGGIIVLLIAFFIWYNLRLRNIVQKETLEASIEAMVSMKAFNDKISSEKMLLRKEIDYIKQTHENDNEIRNLILESLFKDKWSTLNKLCEQYYETGGSEKMKESLTKKIEKEIYNIGSPDGIKAIEEQVNKYLDGIIDRLRKEFPSLKEKDFAFCSLIFAGFSAKAICFILGINNGNFYVKKGRLMKRINESKSPDKDIFLSRMKKP